MDKTVHLLRSCRPNMGISRCFPSRQHSRWWRGCTPSYWSSSHVRCSHHRHPHVGSDEGNMQQNPVMLSLTIKIKIKTKGKEVWNLTSFTTAGFPKTRSLKLFQVYSFMSASLLLHEEENLKTAKQDRFKAPPLPSGTTKESFSVQSLTCPLPQCLCVCDSGNDGTCLSILKLTLISCCRER